MRYLCLATLMMLAALTARADGVNVVLKKDLKTIELHFLHPVPSDFCSQEHCPEGTNVANYQLYEIVNPDNEKIKAEIRTIDNIEATGCKDGRCSVFQVHVPN